MAGIRRQGAERYRGSKRNRGGVLRLARRCLTLTVVIAAGGFLRWGLNPRETSLVRGGEEPGTEPGLVVAYVISFTSLDLPKASFMLDAAEVLIGSIRAACELSRYRCETLAFALPSVAQEGRWHLENIGWRVVEKVLPVAVEDIENDFYRGHVGKTGCCGANEFLKLHAYTLTDYHRVVHLDVDTLVLHPMDELFELDASLVYTTDPSMMTQWSKAEPVQGGFILVRPDLRVYEELRAIVREGDWRIGGGWRGSNIGYFWGGATIQGLLPFYYNIVAPGTATEANRCVYNHMADTEECQSDQYTIIARGSTEFDIVGAASGVSAIKSVHFTWCMKPWWCGKVEPKYKRQWESEPCQLLHQVWSDARKGVLESRGLPLTEACGKGDYAPIPRNESHGS